MSLSSSAKRIALACAATLLLAAPAAAQTHDGDYAGVLDAPGGQKLHLVLHLKTTGTDISAVLDSVDQGVSIPSSAYKVENGEVNILFIAVMGELKGAFSGDGQAFTGSWTQGVTTPLTLTRTAAAPPAKP